MKVMITGGAGFIGSHLADRLLKDNHEVIILDNLSTGRLENIKHIEKQIEFINCDLHLRGAWIQECNSVDVIFHLAALADVVPSVQNPLKYYDSNVNGTFNILTFAKEKNINKFIYAASS